MRSSDLRIGSFRPRSIVLGKAFWVRALLCLAVVTFLPSAACFAQQVGNGLPYPAREPGLPPINETANPTADANRLMLDSMKKQDDMKRFDEMNVQRQKEMTTDTARLLELAHELKTETNDHAPDTLSMLDIRKAEMIEKLAHNVQHKMRASVSK